MRILKKILLIIIGIFLSLIVLEVCLQIAGFTLTTIKKYKNKITKDSNTITILCLGESTTDGQWPPILQKILDEKSKDKKFNVIDKGKCAEKTTYITNNIENWIKDYKPNIVVAMMGINDWKILPWAKNEYNIFENIFSNSKTYRVILYILDCIKSNEKFDDIKDLSLNGYDIYFTKYKKERKISKENILELKKFNNSLKQMFNEKKNNYYFYQLFFKFKDIDYAEIYEMLFNVDDETDSDLIFNHEIFLYAKDKISKIDEKKYNDILFGGIAMEYLQNKDFKTATKYFQKAENYRLKHFIFSTQKNYYKIIDCCTKHDIQFVAMQYPNRSINSLKKMLQKNLHYNEIIFIDNEKIFKIPLLQGKDFHNFFTDQFAGDFGHCTELGNTLIAKNVAKTILKLYN